MLMASSPLLDTIPQIPDGRRSMIVNSIHKLNTCQHFHYGRVELGPVEVTLEKDNVNGLFYSEEKKDNVNGLVCSEEKEKEKGRRWKLMVRSNEQYWCLERGFDELVEFDRQLHRCVFDRALSRLPELGPLKQEEEEEEAVDHRQTIEEYLQRLSQLTGSVIKCYPVLKFLELDNRGYRFRPAEQTPINTPAIAAAVVVRDFLATNSGQLSIKTGDILSLIEMQTVVEKSSFSWWKAKLTIFRREECDHENENNDRRQLFQVGYVPSDCLRLIKMDDGRVNNNNNNSHIKKKKTAAKKASNKKAHVKGSVRVFGVDLTEHLETSKLRVPLIVQKCVEAIEEHGIVAGIYRQSGIQSNIARLRKAFDHGQDPDLSNAIVLRDVHCLASLLKQYFRQLPNSLFTFQLYSEFAKANESPRDCRINEMRCIIERLPDAHYRTAEFLFRHLSRMCSHSSTTDMNSRNLAIVWAPNLFRAPPLEDEVNEHRLMLGLTLQTSLCNFFISHADRLFPVDRSHSIDRDTTTPSCSSMPSTPMSIRLAHNYNINMIGEDRPPNSPLTVHMEHRWPHSPLTVNMEHRELSRSVTEQGQGSNGDETMRHSRSDRTRENDNRRLLSLLRIRAPSLDSALRSWRSRLHSVTGGGRDSSSSENEQETIRLPKKRNSVVSAMNEFKTGLVRSWRAYGARSSSRRQPPITDISHIFLEQDQKTMETSNQRTMETSISQVDMIEIGFVDHSPIQSEGREAAMGEERETAMGKERETAMDNEREAAMDAEKNIERSLDELSRLYESHVDDDPDILPIDLVITDRFENAFPQPVLDCEQKRLSHCSSDGSLHMDVSQYDDLVGDNIHRTSSVYVYKL